MGEEPKPKPKAEQVDLLLELIEEAFEFDLGDPLELEKKILAVAFLLDSCSGGGNKPVNEIIAGGLAELLRNAAKDAAKLRPGAAQASRKTRNSVKRRVSRKI
jgi:hypothetical protein